jgi:hypothetical protein
MIIKSFNKYYPLQTLVSYSLLEALCQGMKKLKEMELYDKVNTADEVLWLQTEE